MSSPQPTGDGLASIPTEMFDEICRYLPKPDLENLQFCSSKLYHRASVHIEKSLDVNIWMLVSGAGREKYAQWLIERVQIFK